MNINDGDLALINGTFPLGCGCFGENGDLSFQHGDSRNIMWTCSQQYVD